MDLFGVFADFAAGAGMSFPASLNELDERSSLRSETTALSQQQYPALIKREEVIVKKRTSVAITADHVKQRRQSHNGATNRHVQETQQHQNSQAQIQPAQADLPMKNTNVQNHANTEMLEFIWCRPICW